MDRVDDGREAICARESMSVLYWLVPYIVCGGILRFIVHRISPEPKEIPRSDILRAVFIFAVTGLASDCFLRPSLGNWRILLEIIFGSLIVQELLHLSFRRSLLAVLGYWATFLICAGIIGAVSKTGAPPAKNNGKPLPTVSNGRRRMLRKKTAELFVGIHNFSIFKERLNDFYQPGKEKKLWTF